MKQGDPSAMVLFVLSFDPILRFIANRISVFDAYPFAYCDDLGIATPVLARTWRVLVQIFVIVKKISSLCINVRKTQLLALGPDPAKQVQCFCDSFPGSLGPFVQTVA